MAGFQVLALILIAIILYKSFSKYRSQEISLQLLLFWFIFWIAGIIVILLPETTSLFANILGVGRGVDLVIYLALGVVFYVLFRFFIRLERLERNQTKIVRKLAVSKPIIKHEEK